MYGNRVCACEKRGNEMRKKMIGIGIIVILIVTGILVWNKTRRVEITKEGQITQKAEILPGGETTSLLAEAETEEEAMEIAELYGISLVKFRGNVAVYETDKDIEELIEMGKKNNYPTLEINYLMELD